MSATELAVVMNYVVSLQQRFDVLQRQYQSERQQFQQQLQLLQGRLATLERKSTSTAQVVSALQAGQVNLQTDCGQLRQDHDVLSHDLWYVLGQTLEDLANLKALFVKYADYCEQQSLEDYWSKRYPEAFE